MSQLVTYAHGEGPYCWVRGTIDQKTVLELSGNIDNNTAVMRSYSMFGREPPTDLFLELRNEGAWAYRYAEISKATAIARIRSLYSAGLTGLFMSSFGDDAARSIHEGKWRTFGSGFEGAIMEEFENQLEEAEGRYDEWRRARLMAAVNDETSKES